MIGLIICIEIILIILDVIFIVLAYESGEHEIIYGIIAIICFLALLIVPMCVDSLHGFIDYKESNDKDLARITSVEQKQDFDYVYYEIQVEYLTNTPTQEGAIQNRNIEKDSFYCYYEDQELVEQLKEHLYEELWIISGYKGGYETYKDFGTKLLKRIELKDKEADRKENKKENLDE